jgi:hypothetical protein
MVMPALIGGFGKINLSYLKRYFSVKSVEDINLISKIGAYLAGLIEADGSIAVHDINSKAKIYHPKIIVVFALVDKPLAEKLAYITNVGTVYFRNNAGHVL